MKVLSLIVFKIFLWSRCKFKCSCEITQLYALLTGFHWRKHLARPWYTMTAWHWPGHNEDTELLHQDPDPSGFPLLATPTSTSPPPTTAAVPSFHEQTLLKRSLWWWASPPPPPPLSRTPWRPWWWFCVSVFRLVLLLCSWSPQSGCFSTSPGKDLSVIPRWGLFFKQKNKTELSWPVTNGICVKTGDCKFSFLWDNCLIGNCWAVRWAMSSFPEETAKMFAFFYQFHQEMWNESVPGRSY